LDLGNRELLNQPKKVYWFFSRRVFNRRFLYELSKRDPGVILYFCQYRFQVDRWLDFCKKRKIRALGCKGGEVSEFVEELGICKAPSVIFATTALSHGVNLPSIRKIFISYRVYSLDFWIQMTGRGGRKGEPFELYHFDRFWGNKLSCVKILLLDIIIRTMVHRLFHAVKSRRPSHP
jgi:hypothetical protein